MLRFLTLAALLLSFTVCAQNINYSLDLIDVNKGPVRFKDFRSHIEVNNGVYFYHQEYDNDFAGAISLFDGEIFTELFTSNERMKLVGATENGAFVIEEAPTFSIFDNVLFVKPNGAVDTINQEPINAARGLQFGSDVYVLSRPSGIRKYTEQGTEELLSDEFSYCNCNFENIVFDEMLVFEVEDGFWATDGTINGTRQLFDGEGYLIPTSSKLYHFSSRDGIQVYDKNTRVVTDFRVGQAGVPEDLSLFQYPVATNDGFFFMGKTSEGGRELFAIDELGSGIFALDEVVPGIEDGIDVRVQPEQVGDYLVFIKRTDGPDREIWISNGSNSRTHRIGTLNDYEFEGINTLLSSVQTENGALFVHIGKYNSDIPIDYIFAWSPTNPNGLATPVDTLFIKSMSKNLSQLSTH